MWRSVFLDSGVRRNDGVGPYPFPEFTQHLSWDGLVRCGALAQSDDLALSGALTALTHDAMPSNMATIFNRNRELKRSFVEAIMSWIREVDTEPGQPARPAVINVMSILPDAMAAVQNLGETVTFGGSTLTRVQEEAIATAVSVASSCRY